jgi:hypothetical protein
MAVQLKAAQPRYAGWVGSDQEFRTQLRDERACMVFADRSSVPESIENPMRVTIIVHRPRIKHRSKRRS